MKTILRSFVAAFAFLIIATAASTALPAQNLQAIQSSMAQRLPQIDQLKAAGALGENNLGYLAVREDKDNAAEIAAAENADRKTVYQALAAKTGGGETVESVGKRRAQMIAKNSKPGVWVQNAQGNWAKK